MNPEPEFHSDVDLSVMLSILRDEEFLKLAKRYRDRIHLQPRMCTALAREAIRRGLAVHPKDLKTVTIQDLGRKNVGDGTPPVSGT